MDGLELLALVKDTHSKKNSLSFNLEHLCVEDDQLKL